MSEGKKDDGVQKLRIAGPKGYALAAALITIILGDNIVDVVITTTAPDVSRDALITRVDDLEKTVHRLEHQALMCSPNYAIKDEDPFEDIWP